MKIRLGETEMDSGYTRSPSRRDVAVSAIFLHESYDELTMVNDIAIIQLQEKIEKWTDFIRPICLATEPWNLEGRMATAAGISIPFIKTYNFIVLHIFFIRVGT